MNFSLGSSGNKAVVNEMKEVVPQRVVPHIRLFCYRDDDMASADEANARRPHRQVIDDQTQSGEEHDHAEIYCGSSGRERTVVTS
jgi:hypothetical protein